MKKLSFVIPCYYSEKTVENVIRRIISTVEKDGRFEYEIICVNDGSTDGTFSVLKRCAEENFRIKAVDLSKNYGQHAALMAGFHYVTGDIVVCLDDDGQNPPEEMFRLIDKLEEGYDLVSAKYENEHKTFVRRMGTRVSFFMSEHLIGKPKNIDLNSYYVTRRYVIDEVIRYRNAYPFVHGLILRVTRNMANVVITHDERSEGSSGYSMKRLVSLWMNGFTAFSEKPLRLASFLGFFCALVGFAFAVYVVIKKILNPSVPLGYSSMMAVMLILAGIVMLMLGLLGEYIGRIYISINSAPQYVVKESINTEKSHEE